MTKLFSLRSICCLLFALTAPLCARAQLVSPWFRGSPQAWKTLTETSFSAPRLTAARLSVPLSGLSTGRAVKTTVPNWLSHRLSHSNTFSRMEKEIFTVHSANLPAVTGKLTYFSDRDALLAANAANHEINPDAFARHQQLLKHTLAEVEAFSREEIAAQIQRSVFSAEELQRLLKDPSQPAAFVLTAWEVKQFPALSLEQQRAFALNAGQNATSRMLELLRQNPQTIPTRHFSEYYYLKLRRRYFSLLYKALTHAQTPRKTLIVRVHKTIPLAFLPQPNIPLTDAQRLGKLHYHLGLLQANGHHSAADLVALKTEIARQTELYQPYALAEAFGLPYEQVLARSVYGADLYFSEQEAQNIMALSWQQTLDELPAKIARVQTKMKEMQSRKTILSPQEYADYFRLAAQHEFLQARLAQAKFFLLHLP